MNKINQEDKTEFLGQVIDIFEDWLTEKGITIKDIPNDEREEYNGGDLEGLAIIFGSDYDDLQYDLEELMVNWKLMDKED